MWKDFKYLFAYTIPLAIALGLYFKGIWSYNGIWYAFLLVPILELYFKGTEENLSEEEEKVQNGKGLFDFLLYLNVPILWGITIWYFYLISFSPLETYEFVGLSISVGIYLGGVGINVAHELGHRTDKFSQWMAKLLLLPNWYLHFIIEHNRGHHVHIATPKDPASSRFNENIYAFYFRSVWGAYTSAWELEAERLKRSGKHWLSVQNEMIHFQLIQITYLVLVGLSFSWQTAGIAVLVGILGFLMLETVNYIEHYGLERKQLESGRYERVSPMHSWNCNEELGRILLYELTRHSDHHYKATRKYQTLRHFENTPMLPTGYPGCMLMALCPPLWFSVMNPRVKKVREIIAQ